MLWKPQIPIKSILCCFNDVISIFITMTMDMKPASKAEGDKEILLYNI